MGAWGRLSTRKKNFIAEPGLSSPVSKQHPTMKKIFLMMSLFLLVAGTVRAQKMVIGSRIPDFKGVEWLTTQPDGAGSDHPTPMLIEFHHPSNASCIRFFPKLASIWSDYGTETDGLQIVVLVAQDRSYAEQMYRDYGDKYFIGIDPDGRVYQTFNVQFLPYTLVVNSRGEVYWQGNLGNLPNEVLQKVK